MKEDKETKTVNKIYNPDKACPGLDPGDPEAKSGSDQYPRVEKKSRALKISIWIGIPTIALIIIFWVLHEWSGFLLPAIYIKFDFADNQCEWIANNVPVFIIGKGLVKSGCTISLYWLKNRGEEGVPYLIEYLDDWCNDLREDAAQCLGELGKIAIEAYPHLIELEKKDPDIRVRRAASLALFRINPRHPEVIQIINKYILQYDVEQKIEIFKKCGNIGLCSKDTVNMLKSHLNDLNINVRLEAAFALFNISHSERVRSASALIKTFRYVGKKLALGKQILLYLQKVNPDPNEIISEIINNIEEVSNFNTQKWLFVYLNTLDLTNLKKDKLLELCRLLVHDSISVRMRVIKIIGKIKDKSILPLLKEAYQTEKNDVLKNKIGKAIESF